MSYPQVRLVDTPSSSATVLFDFNDDTTAAKRFVLDDGFSLGVPELVGDVDAVDPLYGPRTVSFTLRITGTKANALAAQSALARRLLAGRGWLQVRLHSTSDLLFFRTYRAQPGDLSFERVMSTATTSVDDWDLEVNLPCEPMAYGERVTHSVATVTNNPLSGANPARLTLPAILGDAPAPLRLSITPSTTASSPRVMAAIHSGLTSKTPYSLPVGSGDGMTVGADTGADVASSSYIGGSYRPISFATNAALVTRLTFSGVTPGAGRWKILARVAAVTPFAGNMRATVSGNMVGSKQLNMGPTVDVPLGGGSTYATWVDLGDFSVPLGAPPNVLDLPSTSLGSHTLEIAASRTSASGTLNIDQIIYVPVAVHGSLKSNVVLSSLPSYSWDTFTALTVDGDAEAVWMADPSTGALTSVLPYPPSVEGVFPAAVPGAVNVLALLLSVDTTGGDSITRTTSVVVSYHPRWLWIGDS